MREEPETLYPTTVPSQISLLHSSYLAQDGKLPLINLSFPDKKGSQWQETKHDTIARGTLQVTSWHAAEGGGMTVNFHWDKMWATGLVDNKFSPQKH